MPTSAIVDAALSIWTAAKDAAVPSKFMAEQVVFSGKTLRVQGNEFDLSNAQQLFVFGAGKASEAMAMELLNCLEASDYEGKVSGQIHTIGNPDGAIGKIRDVEFIPVRRPTENYPTPTAFQATQRLLHRLHSLDATDLAIGLISGGGSAMLAHPPNGISLNEKCELTRTLAESGADIIKLNSVRRELSQVKGGRLLDHLSCDRLVALILSDIITNDARFVASGPTFESPSNPRQALDIIERFDRAGKAPRPVLAWLRERASLPPQPPTDSTTSSSPTVNNLVVADNRTAVAAAKVSAEAKGFSVVQHELPKTGVAESLGIELAKVLQRAVNGEFCPQVCVVLGSETTVNLCESPGLGGRNQQLVLAALEHLVCKNSMIFEKADFCFLSGGTDGEDGPTNAAGAWFDHDILQNCMQRDDLKPYLERNDAMAFFDSIGSLIVTGPTQTNVCDIQVLTVQIRDR